MGSVAEFLEEFEPTVGLGPTPSQVRGAFKTQEGLLSAGVYALTLDGEIVYIGKAKILIQRLYTHWNTLCRFRSGKELPDRFKLIEFNGVKTIPCSTNELDKLEKQMIARYRPKYNKRLRPDGKVTLEEIGFNFTRFGINNVVETPVYRRRIT